VIWDPHFGGRGGRSGSAMVPFKRAMVVSYMLSVVTIALSVTIWPQLPSDVSYTLKSIGGKSLLGQNLGRTGVTDVSQI